MIVASPNFTHRAVLEPLFDAGLHILCEKPLATTLEDCRWIVDRAAQSDRVFWTAMEYRYMPPAAAFIDDIRAGRIGRLQMLSIREHRFPFLVKVADWNRFNRNTGGTMVEKCCHFFDLMRLIVGAEAVRVYCSGAMDVNHLDEAYSGETPDIIDNSYTTVDFANGVRAMLDLSMFADWRGKSGGDYRGRRPGAAGCADPGRHDRPFAARRFPARKAGHAPHDPRRSGSTRRGQPPRLDLLRTSALSTLRCAARGRSRSPRTTG